MTGNAMSAFAGVETRNTIRKMTCNIMGAFNGGETRNKIRRAPLKHL